MTRFMDRLPELPKRLPIDTIKPGAQWVRIHSSHREALWFGPALGMPPVHRFDDPSGEYRTCYLSTRIAGAFAETFLRNPPVRVLALSDLATRRVSTVEVLRKIRLVPLYGPALSRIGVTAEIVNQKAYGRSRHLARGLWRHSNRPDGIIYRCRHDDSAFSIALFDRARDAVASVGHLTLVDDLDQLAKLLKRYGVALTP